MAITHSNFSVRNLTQTQHKDTEEPHEQGMIAQARVAFVNNDSMATRVIKAGLEIPRGVSNGVNGSMVIVGLPLLMTPAARKWLPVALPAAAVLGAAVGFSFGIGNAIGRIVLGNAFDPIVR